MWKSLQTSDFELAVVRLGWLQASVTATRFEHKNCYPGGSNREREEEPGDYRPPGLKGHIQSIKTVAALPQSRKRDEAEETVKPVPLGPPIASSFANYMREHAHRRTQAQIRSNLVQFLRHANLKETAPVSSMTKPLISAWKAKRLTEVSPTTVARNLRLLGHYCAWLSNEGYLPVDPSAKLGVAVRTQRAAKVRRKDFTPEQMRLVSDALAKRRGTARTKYLEEYFWICQVVLFSGMRSAEAWSLWTDRIQVDGGVPFFDLQESKERDVNVKTNASARRAPVHSGFVDLGFLNYVTVRREAVKLFPTINNRSPVSRLFMETLRKVGITDRALTLHLLGDGAHPCWRPDGTQALHHRARVARDCRNAAYLQ